MKQKLNLFILFLILFIGQVNYVKADTTIASGTISGTSIIWTLTSPNGAQENMKLSFTGSGKIPSFASGPSPWEFSNPKITEAYIPSTITEIGDYTFYKAAFSSINIPSSCTRIGLGAFESCTNLKEIYIPSSVVSIGEQAFWGCTNLSSIRFEGRCPANMNNNTFDNVAAKGVFYEKSGSGTSYARVPSGWTYYTHDGITRSYVAEGTLYVSGNGAYTTLGYYAGWYSQSSSIKKIVVEEGVTNIGDKAFYGCANVTEVTLNNTGTIGSTAFYGCVALTRVNIGTGLTELKALPGASFDEVAQSTPFYDCSSLSTINVASLASFLKIGNLEYLTYYGVKEKTLMVNGVTHSSSSELVIPEGVTEIPNVAFRYFNNVTKIKLPSTMTKIADYNFQFHNYLKKITLPSTITSIGLYAFYYCDNLKRIVCKATTPPATTSSIASYPSWIAVKVPTGKTATYKAASVWKEFSIDEGRTLNYNVKMLPNESKQFTNNLLDYLNVKSRTTTNSSIASSTVSSNIVTIKAGNNPTYDGSTTLPYKSAVISLKLEDDDQLVYNVEVYPREAELTDGNAYKNTKEFEVDKVSYTRSFSEKIIGKWQCFYAPFDIEITDELLEDFDFAKLYMVSYKDENDNGEIEDGEPLKMMLNKLSAGKILHANKPYFIKTKSACTKTFVATNAVLKAAARGSVRCCTTEHEYSLVGIYNPTNIKGFYTMGTSGGFSYYTTDKTINQYRWYMEIKSLTEDGGEYENYARPIEIFVEGEDETTGIIALENKVSDSQNDKIYTLDGRQVTDFETLPSGIYIVNGKKVFKK